MKAKTSKNVFRDLGFNAEEAENLRIRSALMVAITKHIQQTELTQKEAAHLLGVTQPRISDLIRGRIEVFSIDTLIAMLSRLGVKTSIRVGNKNVA
jgi:predicted XRE-type DNA-binding protein